MTTRGLTCKEINALQVACNVFIMPAGASYHGIIKNLNFMHFMLWLSHDLLKTWTWIPNLNKDIHSGDVKEAVNLNYSKL